MERSMQFSETGSPQELQTRDIENGSGSDVEHSETPRKSSNDPLDKIANLLMENDGDEQETESSNWTQDSDGARDAQAEPGREEGEPGEEAGEESRQERRLATLQDAAKALGTNAAKMYDLQIPMGQGEEPRTLGELKDAFRDRSGWQQEFAQREQMLTAREVENARVQQDLAYLQEEVLANVRPERLKEMEHRQEAQLRLEGVMLQQKVPEFREQNYFNKWREDAVEFTGKFGFRPHELVIQDHRLVHMLHHMMRLEKKLDSLAQIEPVRIDPPRRKRGGVQSAKQPRPRTKGSGPDLDALANLVKGSL
jgi:hypothetical protein